MEKKNKNSIQYFAMMFGTYMGIFWILKFPLFPLGLTNSFLLLLFFFLTISVPFLGYHYGKVYRDRVCGGSIRFVHAWLFLFLVYLFAAILTSVGHYIYFRYIDNGYIINFYSKAIEGMKNNPMFPKEYYSQAKDLISIYSGLTPIKIALQFISQNVFYGNILALITALFVMKRPK